MNISTGPIVINFSQVNTQSFDLIYSLFFQGFELRNELSDLKI